MVHWVPAPIGWEFPGSPLQTSQTQEARMHLWFEYNDYIKYLITPFRPMCTVGSPGFTDPHGPLSVGSHWLRVSWIATSNFSNSCFLKYLWFLLARMHVWTYFSTKARTHLCNDNTKYLITPFSSSVHCRQPRQTDPHGPLSAGSHWLRVSWIATSNFSNSRGRIEPQH